ncbi:MAG: hypothetical protein WC624_02385 [Candidatus Margulisiibacteriota bacterium]
MIKKAFLFLLIVTFAANIGYAKDFRAVKVKKFLAKYPGSPLRGHEHEILYWADKFKLDYRLYLAIAGVESTFGKTYPKHNSNLTGILNGSTHFESIHDNIYQTQKLIATGKWYKKYRNTNNLKDLVYTYKGVPPYEPYLRSIKSIMKAIASVPIEKEKSAYQAWLAKINTSAFFEEVERRKPKENATVWNAVRYDQYKNRRDNSVDMKEIAKRLAEITNNLAANRIGVTKISLDSTLTDQ